MANQSPSSPPDARSPSGTPAPRIKPRSNVKRTQQAVRDKYQKENEAREAKRAKDAAKSEPSTAAARGGRGGRGRGGAAQPGTRQQGASGEGAIFGASDDRPKTRAREALGAGSDELIEGSEAAKIAEATKTLEAAGKNGASARAKKHVVVEEPKSQDAAEKLPPIKVVENTIEVDNEPEEERRDIEKIWISSDEEADDDDVVDGKGKSVARATRITGGLRPVRAPRTFRAEGNHTDSRAKTPHRAPKRSDTAPIDVDEMDVDEPEVVKEVPSSPEQRKKHLKKQPGKQKEVKFLSETPEERTERLRLVDDTVTLRSIFTADDAAKRHGKAGVEGQLFLLQLPPLTPLLVDPNAPREPEDDDVVEVKQEEGSATDKGKGPVIKKDPDAPKQKLLEKKKAPHDHGGVFQACCPPDRLPGGLVGKLNVHASGKITLDWGGTDMEVRLGTEVDFLQDAVLLQTKKDDSTNGTPAGGGNDGEQGDGKAYALGQVKGKMVVIPDWGKLYD